MCPTTVFKNVHPFKVWALGIHLDCCSSALAYTVETFLCDTSIQGTQNLTPKNCGTPLFSGKGLFFWVPKPRFNLHSGDNLVLIHH